MAFETTLNTVFLHVQADQCFELVLREGATSVTVITSSVTERDDWLAALRRLLERRIGEQRRAYPSATTVIVDHYRRGVFGDSNLWEGGRRKKKSSCIRAEEHGSVCVLKYNVAGSCPYWELAATDTLCCINTGWNLSLVIFIICQCQTFVWQAPGKTNSYVTICLASICDE